VRSGRVAALLLVVMVAALVIAGCGGGGSTSDSLPASPAGKADAANFDGVHSGEIELVLQIDRYKKHPEEVNMRAVGSFMKTGEEVLPQLDLAIESNGDFAGHHVEFLSGPLLRADKWIFNFAGKVYEPDPATFHETKSKLEDAQGEDGGEGNATACLEAAAGVQVTDFVNHASFEGKGETIDGAKVETVGADLDISAAIDVLIELQEKSPGCEAQLEAVGLPPAPELKQLAKELQGSLTASRLTLGLDKHGLARYFKILTNVELPHSEELEVELVVRLNRINEITELPNTHGYTPYPALLKQFGLTGEDVQRADAGEIYVAILGVLADRLFGREGA
jgi:hypothetical protein